MLRFLIAILVMITLLSNLNGVNGNDFYKCLHQCYEKRNPYYAKECFVNNTHIECKQLLNECLKECRA
ncbi:hypothetical protein DDB_G0281757 [Dictyostelium discoideum AX4]|uniref:Uncharacterized protein n=1 Tax=Dictyostelium discoideum TaxID=44689 RepID=Q54TG9_DICDI|nr:hypothetical protein DDB_G0281757 [Dictyostelium discoideum AX4]EAL66640.1 hypothetical protein DDB_G0281757 [Dictyostelium discoideum AX4]|eukprot:XP_640622.1 hypothetical protein DDB_G0281757 [Dictyostelium discoideum AX4]